MVGYSNELGNIHYSEDVLGKIVGLSTMECYGVVGMVSKNATEGFWELMRIENLSKGVKLNFNEDNKLEIELFVMVEYGNKISVIANNIIQKVRYSVENFTGLKVSSVTVNVQAVRV
ncbi:Asp23/Gls24 family envelope stress response protein [Clostridium chauvoei]|uniref:Asp23/Gls24 family envelope stress response protein n=2 Tax=Clostridium chauvoei TaxID=46867 RepID=S6EZ32_9CLOT|nr:Asp23/Gls24 family envelope stress response protein [Clostridium chauvoei]ATD54925.1 alkaline-shock protein [Clostridium chauvoei]ATD57396.1 alkaline-shock protein [Clostridium chauvoei]MBX7280460.1 Asp23/Gls24 family envelope stress response protein [Clostridium chauvoei]MBX7282945.1 Asp23/Gls24 family envelope stress response protein [Clostridium chauvoei]MBX7285462.1 Asp23/Gls24 family envelope stress response protein [Clostridium chauvoei]